MLTKIRRQDCLNQYQTFPLRGYDYDNDEETFFYPTVFKSYILTLRSKSFKGHVKSLGLEVIKLAKALQFDTLLFLGDTEIPWLYQHNDYKPAKEAQEYLTGKKIGKRFNGALQVDTSELPTFIKHLAWLTRCNAALPYFHFIDQEQNTIGHVCKYGNLHLDTLNEQADKNLKQFVYSSKFEYGDNNSCYNWFVKQALFRGDKPSCDRKHMPVTAVWRQWGTTNKFSSANRYQLLFGQTEFNSSLVLNFIINNSNQLRLSAGHYKISHRTPSR